jgi:chemotaxis protein MotB
MAKDQPIVIKKVKKGGGHGHHGGAWKVAYADFVTAMMAFFLLMWLINTTSPEQKRGIADYFAPSSASQSQSGSGGVLAGTALGDDGAKNAGSHAVMKALVQPKQPSRATRKTEEAPEQASSGGAEGPAQQQDSDPLQQAMSRREDALFQSAEMSLRQAIQDMPELAELSKHIIIDQTPEGLRVQLIDQEGRPMFLPGTAELNERGIRLIRAVTRVIEKLPNRVTVSGHTDSSPSLSTNYTNWELSSDRANAARRVLETSGLSQDRVYNISGKAGSEPLFPDDPYQASNRRISIVLLREAPVLPPNHKL